MYMNGLFLSIDTEKCTDFHICLSNIIEVISLYIKNCKLLLNSVNCNQSLKIFFVLLNVLYQKMICSMTDCMSLSTKYVPQVLNQLKRYSV